MLTTRSVTPGDLGLICRHREQMFRDMGRPDEPIEAMIEPFRAWLEKRLSDGTYFGFITEEAGRPVGGIGIAEVGVDVGAAFFDGDRGVVAHQRVPCRASHASKSCFAALSRAWIRSKSSFGVLMPLFDFFWKQCRT